MVTLTGTFTRLDGTPATGTVKVTPSRSPIMDPDGKVVISGPQTFPLGVDGTLSVPIPASNDPDLGPPFTYWINVNLTHASWKINKVWIPHGSATVDISEIADYTPTPGVATRVVTIPADGTDGQVLVWDGVGFSWDFPPTGPQGPEGPSGDTIGSTRVVNLMDSRDYHLTGYAQITPTRVTLTPGHKYYARRTYDGPVSASSGTMRTTDPTHAFITAKDTSAVTTYSGIEAPDRWVYIYGVAGESHSYTDVVLVDLTETFGSGNEPGLAYMDNLVRREGGWFDTSSPVVGNAFAESVVAGPGMSLRHDNSVGERVFLDHPGGTTMLSGDTGWRNIATLVRPDRIGPITGGASSYCEIWREGNLVTCRMSGPSLVTNTAVTSLTTVIPEIPAGFRPGKYFSMGVAVANGILLSVGNYLSLASLELRGILDEGDVVRFTASWHTTDSWPTTLPGTPA